MFNATSLYCRKHTTSEISENKNSKEFTSFEKANWYKRLERIKKIKAKERQAIAGSENLGIKLKNLPQLAEGKTRDVVCKCSRFGSGKQYEKAKYIDKKKGLSFNIMLKTIIHCSYP